MVDGTPQPALFEYEFAIAGEWTTGTQYRSDPDFGRSPIVYEYGTPVQSYWYGFGRTTSVLMSTRFRDDGIMAIEQKVSPLPMVRVLRSDRMENSDWSVREEESVTVLEIHPKRTPARQRISFEAGSHRLVRSELLSPAGEVLAETSFEDWTPIGDGYEVPTTVITIYHAPGSVMTMTSTLSDLQLLNEDNPPARKPMPADATIDNFDTGLTTTPDGTVIGEITRNSVPAQPTDRAGGWLSARNLMIAGVMLLLGSGVIVGLRRWKSA